MKLQKEGGKTTQELKEMTGHIDYWKKDVETPATPTPEDERL